MTIQITDNSSQIVGEGTWTIVYNFEGYKTVGTCVWVEDSLWQNNTEYTITVTAHLNTKFGKTWTDVMTDTFIYMIL